MHRTLNMHVHCTFFISIIFLRGMSDLSELLRKGRIWQFSWATSTCTTTVKNICLIFFWSHRVSKGSWLINASKMLQRVVLSRDFVLFFSSMHCKCFSAWFRSVTNRSRKHKSPLYKRFNFLFLCWGLVKLARLFNERTKTLLFLFRIAV